MVVLHLPFHPVGCAPKWDLLVNAVQIDEDDLLDLGLGKSIYSKKQVNQTGLLDRDRGAGLWRKW